MFLYQAGFFPLRQHTLANTHCLETCGVYSELHDVVRRQGQTWYKSLSTNFSFVPNKQVFACLGFLASKSWKFKSSSFWKSILSVSHKSAKCFCSCVSINLFPCSILWSFSNVCQLNRFFIWQKWFAKRIPCIYIITPHQSINVTHTSVMAHNL